MTEIFQTMRLLSICMTHSKLSPYVQALFTRGLYVAEYKLLVVLDQTDPRDDDIVLSRSSHIYGSCRLAAYLYLYLMLREIPRTAEINYTLARRLKDVLDSNKADLLVFWKDDLYLLLWIVTMGAVVTKGSSEGNYFLGLLNQLKEALTLESFETYKRDLSKILSIENNCWKTCILGVWNAT